MDHFNWLKIITDFKNPKFSLVWSHWKWLSHKPMGVKLFFQRDEGVRSYAIFPFLPRYLPFLWSQPWASNKPIMGRSKQKVTHSSYTFSFFANRFKSKPCLKSTFFFKCTSYLSKLNTLVLLKFQVQIHSAIALDIRQHI